MLRVERWCGDTGRPVVVTGQPALDTEGGEGDWQEVRVCGPGGGGEQLQLRCWDSDEGVGGVAAVAVGVTAGALVVLAVGRGL